MKHVIGKIVGGGLGFLMGGPMGGAFGFVLGHLHDKWREFAPVRGPMVIEGLYFPGLAEGLQRSVYTTGVVVLGAKLAKADGAVSREEIAAFRRVFRVPDSQAEAIGNLFDRARASADGYEPYAMRLAQVFAHELGVLEEIMTGLFAVAAADGPLLSADEAHYLRRVAALFGFTESEFFSLAARSGARLPSRPSPSPQDPYAVLGVTREADEAAIKRAYRALIREHHPDKMAAAGPDAMAQAN